MDVEAEICDFPVCLKTRSDVSVATLVAESGYRRSACAEFIVREVGAIALSRCVRAGAHN